MRSVNPNIMRRATWIRSLVVVGFCLIIFPNVSVFAQVASPLEVTLTVSSSTFPVTREAVGLVKLKNTGTSPIVLPAIDEKFPDKYISLEITHESGKSIFFLRSVLAERPVRIAGSTIRLYPSQQISFNLTVNEFGSGFWGYENPNTPASLRTYLGNFNVRAKFTVDDSNLPTGGDVSNVFRGTVFSAPTTINVTAPIPSLMTEENSTRASVLDSVTFVRDPFPVFTRQNFSPDQHTRVMLFATDIPVEDFSSVTVQAEDSQQRVLPLAVEYVGKVPNLSWLIQVVVRLPDELTNAGDVKVSISVRGTVSNKLLLSIRPSQ